MIEYRLKSKREIDISSKRIKNMAIMQVTVVHLRKSQKETIKMLLNMMLIKFVLLLLILEIMTLNIQVTMYLRAAP